MTSFFLFFSFFFRPIYYLRPSFALSLQVVTQIRGHTAGSSPPIPFYRENISAYRVVCTWHQYDTIVQRISRQSSIVTVQYKTMHVMCANRQFDDEARAVCGRSGKWLARSTSVTWQVTSHNWRRQLTPPEMLDYARKSLFLHELRQNQKKKKGVLTTAMRAIPRFRCFRTLRVIHK